MPHSRDIYWQVKMIMKETKLLSVRDAEQDKKNIETAANLLRQGGLVAIPTETVYGLGANALNPRAVKAIFTAKGRPQDNPLIIHICQPEQAEQYAREIPSAYYALCRRFSPGPLTVILKKKDIIPPETSGGLDTVAIRIPSHPVARAIIQAAGVPVAAPSANLSGSPSPTTAQHCIHDLWGRVDAIVDAGECSVGLESTVISLAGERPILLRPGAVTPEQLEEVLGPVEIHQAVTGQLEGDGKAASPGMKYKHYSPKAKITILRGSSAQYTAYVNSRKGPGVYALCFEEDIPNLLVPYVSWGSSGSESSQAHRLFAALRELDQQGAQRVYARCPEKSGIGLAVYNRLIRAAAFDEQEAKETF